MERNLSDVCGKYELKIYVQCKGKKTRTRSPIESFRRTLANWGPSPDKSVKSIIMGGGTETQ